MAFYFDGGEGYQPLGEGGELPQGADLYEKWGNEDSGGFNKMDPRILQDSNIRYGEPNSLEYLLAKIGGLSGDGFSNPNSVGSMLRNSGAPADYDWSGAIGNTFQNQQAQFGGWSGADDPGQTALKFLSNVDAPWATTSRMNLLNSPEFALGQRQGEAAVNYDPDEGNILGIPKPVLYGMLAAGGAQAGLFGDFGGAADWSALAEGEGGISAALGSGAGGNGIGLAAGNFDPMGAVLTQAGGAGSGAAGGSILDQVKQMLTKGLPGLGGTGGGGLGTLSSIYNIGSGIYGMTQANDMKKMAEQIAERSDPFASSRPQYVNQLNALMADPSQIVNAPGYRAGEQAVTRKMASQGYIGSGNMMKALQDFGGNIFDQQVSRLASLAGAGAAPGSGMGTAANVMNSGNAALMSALNRIGYGLKGGL